MNRNRLVIVLAAAAVALLTIGLIAAPKLTNLESAEGTRVDAPFTSVETGKDGTTVRTPFVDVEVPKDKKEPAH